MFRNMEYMFEYMFRNMRGTFVKTKTTVAIEKPVKTNKHGDTSSIKQQHKSRKYNNINEKRTRATTATSTDNDKNDKEYNHDK